MNLLRGASLVSRTSFIERPMALWLRDSSRVTRSLVGTASVPTCPEIGLRSGNVKHFYSSLCSVGPHNHRRLFSSDTSVSSSVSEILSTTSTAPCPVSYDSPTEPVRVRYAPSPTGSLHLGGLRTALYNYLFAKKHRGKCLLRIEDTDRTRLVPEATFNLQRDLAWSGIHFDEGPGDLGGDCGPYIQSERLHLYKQYSEQLIQQGHAYRCFCSSARLDELRTRQAAKGAPSVYDRLCLPMSQEEQEARIARGEPYVVRMKIPAGTTVVQDAVRGTVVFQNKIVDDQVLMKSDGFPTYHLANIVDDHLMGITHVIRGEEWLSSAVKHVVLYNMFGWKAPVFAHLPLLLREDGSKLSKRFKDASLEYYIEKGYLPEALMNFVALLGWHPSLSSVTSNTSSSSSSLSDSPAAADTSSTPTPISNPTVIFPSAAAAPAVPMGDLESLKVALMDSRHAKGKVQKVAAAAAASSSVTNNQAASSASTTTVLAASTGKATPTSSPSSPSSSKGESISEVYSLDQLISLFTLAKVHKAGAAVDLSKLLWLHGQYWKAALVSDIDRLASFAQPRVEELVNAYVAKGNVALDPLLTDGVVFKELSNDPRNNRAAILAGLGVTHDHPYLLSEFPHEVFFVWARPDLSAPAAQTLKSTFWVSVSSVSAAAAPGSATAGQPVQNMDAKPVAAAAKKKKNEAKGPPKPSVHLLKALRAAVATWTPEVLTSVSAANAAIKTVVKAENVAIREVFLPARFALSGSLSGPSVGEQIVALGQAETLHRLDACISEANE